MISCSMTGANSAPLSVEYHQRSRDRDNLTQLVGWVSLARAFVMWSAPDPRVTHHFAHHGGLRVDRAF